MVPWAWGMNGALSVVGATLAIFIAMNWGFQVTLLAASATYLIGLAALLASDASWPQSRLAVTLNALAGISTICAQPLSCSRHRTTR